MTRRRRQFDASFKLEVVRMVRDQGLSVSVRIPADRDQSFRIIVTADSGIVTGISGLS